ncbi:MAG: DUF3078 domain-containing protein [Bacteroidales bacterium]|nr:DUF3078 domain-containing protein [Bacteroidales bacterium]
MRYLTTTALSIFALTVFAKGPQTDTIGMKISRTQQTIQTTTYIEHTIDSIVSLDPKTGINKITILTHDTLRTTETTEVIDTNYLISKPLKYWQLGSQNEATTTILFRTYWTDGNANSYSLFLRNQSFANYSRGLSSWRNELDWRYGMQKQGSDPLFKTHDRFAIESQYGFRASTTWNYSALFQFNTQLTKSYESATADKENYISRFLSPARFTFALGMEYQSTPDKSASNRTTLLLSPIAYRATYVWDTILSGRFGIHPHEHWLQTFGPMAMLTNKYRVNEDIALGSKLELFANILDMKDPFVTVDWKVNVDFRLSRYFTLSFESWLIYDPNVFFDRDRKGNPVPEQRRWQYQQSWMLRFVHRFTN